MPPKHFLAGEEHKVLVYCKPDGSCPVQDFLRAMQASDRRKLVALIQSAAINGPTNNHEKNKIVEGHRYWEFKTPGFRVFRRWSKRGEIVLMHAFVKRTARTPQRELTAGDVLYGLVEKDLEDQSERG